MKIILPIDFSENSHQALELIVSLSEAKKTDITLLHVVELIYDFASQAAVALNSLHKEAESSLIKMIQKYQTTEIKFEYLILDGTASISIARTAQQLKANLIVMGTQGASKIKKTLIGSTTINTIKESKTPVLVIPAGPSPPKLKKITLALEIADHEQMSIDWVRQLSQKWNLQLEFLHVKTGSSFRENLLVEGLEAHLIKNYPNSNVKLRTYLAPTAEDGLKQYSKESKEGILVMCHQNRGFIDQIISKSHSIQMAYYSHLPLLVINLPTY